MIEKILFFVTKLKESDEDWLLNLNITYLHEMDEEVLTTMIEDCNVALKILKKRKKRGS